MKKYDKVIKNNILKNLLRRVDIEVYRENISCQKKLWERIEDLDLQKGF